jgi:phospholipid/cholesterol/gamma-HCH transport system substrate-binding protein
LWLGRDITVQSQTRYSVYFTESVSGLYLNAPVKYHGVVVGRVDQMALAEGDPQRVHVVLAVNEGTPIKTDTRAKLDPQGVTGVVYIELTGGTKEAPMLTRREGAPYPVIESTPSLFSRLDETLTDSLQTLNALAAQIGNLLNSDNQRNVQDILANLSTFSSMLAANSQRLENTLASTEQLMLASTRAAASLPETLGKVRQTLDRWDALAGQLETAGGKLEEMAVAGQRGLTNFDHRTLPEINALIGDLRALTDDLSNFAQDLQDNPRMLLFGSPKAAPGPGE